jgi:hypothetical protein
VIFEPLPRLTARADALYKVRVKALARNGNKDDWHTQVYLTSDALTKPVLEEESTTAYGDPPEPRP